MYQNQLDPQSCKHLTKGQIGEDLFFAYCIKQHFSVTKTTLSDDYNAKIDFYLNAASVAVKNNYNPQFNTVVIEVYQLHPGSPEAWLFHATDYVAFVVKGAIHLVPLPALRTLVLHLIQHKAITLTRRQQWQSKGTYILAYLPTYFLETLPLSKQQLLSLM